MRYNKDMKTYDYYKNQESHKLFAEAQLVNEDGNVYIEVNQQLAQAYGYPSQIDKGVWSVSGNRYVPEGAPNFDENGELRVWGKKIAPRAICEGTQENDCYTRKLVESSKVYWANK